MNPPERAPLGRDQPDLEAPRLSAAPIWEGKMSEEMGLGLSPEDWVATQAWAYDQWPFGRWSYSDPVLDRWVQEVTHLLFERR